ncbi:hypothetical protein B0H66DRAFT_300251 [Apodospora peruviana]|uniref:Protein sip5 n=1 Tax=Apodospora peruviana TaxID=516989 RepID=A0AAE0I1Y9_9PEZI|nr:hypothetical protein B0H66DRAFT_300251 [Apodospora peruviana]
MGNASTKESRGGDAAHRGHQAGFAPGVESGAGTSVQSDRSSNRRGRVSRGDLGGILGLGPTGGSGSHSDAPYERRETKQEREARKLERERVARLAERERSMREEHVDGGFLVTMGTYTGLEDFNKQIVRQLQIERKMAPFWRGLNDFDDQWTEPQIIAAARGLPVPAADQTPPDELIPRLLSSDSPTSSTQNLSNLTVPMGGRTQSATSEHSLSNAGSALGSPVSAQPPRTSSPFKPRGKALAAVLGGTSRNGSTTEIMPREINLPNDPFVNGQPIEVFLYKDATECPICFLSYPPYLNHTRCCDQPICSECFVQIKRPDPHFPEGHNENDPNTNPEETAGLLVSEPACCPYCTQPEFGVTYEPPPFRRGLTYTVPPPTLGSMHTAMSSNSSLNSANLSPSLPSPAAAAAAGRRRTQSLSTHAHNVILTDRIRPEWASKLQAARAHQARRAAAATALHTAAFLMGNTETRAFRSRFGRRNTGGSGSGPTGAVPGGANNVDGDNGDNGSAAPSYSGLDLGARGNPGPALVSSGGGNRRSRMEDLEDMMFMEAIRLSLAAEEERKRKAEKEEKKEAKKREKEERKAAKAAAKHGGPYEGGAEGRSGHSSASGSSLSLPGFGRKRGNSGASNLRVEASVASAMVNTGTSAAAVADPNLKDKGKAIDRSLPMTPEGSEPVAAGPSAAATSVSAPRPIPSPHQPAGPSHLRQMSSASSVSSSLLDSRHGSYTSPSHLQDPRASGLSLGSRSGASEDGGDQDREKDPSASTEPMFNFRSLAEVVGVSLEGEHAGRRLSHIEADRKAKDLGDDKLKQESQANSGEAVKSDGQVVEVERVEDVSSLGAETAGTTISNVVEPERTLGSQKENQPAGLAPPKVTVTPETPAPTDDIAGDSKQLGNEATAVESAFQVTQ